MDNQTPTFGGQRSQDQPYCSPNQFPCHQQSSMYPLEYQQSGQPDYAMGSHIYHQEVDIVPPPTTRKCKEKNVSQRGGGGGVGFTQEEDKVLCSAFLNIGKDPITGVGQSLGSYNKRFHDYYNMFKPEGSNRSQLAVQNRWTSIKKSIDDAVKVYEAKEPFHFMHCWRILRTEAKWNDKVLELNSISAGTGANGSSETNSAPAAVTEGGNESSMPARREGRDSAKRKRVADTSSSSTAVDVLQRIHANRERCQQKEDEQMVQILTRKDEKLSIQREFLDLKKQQREENLVLRQQEAANATMQAEAQLLSTEAAIMSVDIDKVAPHLKNYYIDMQR